MARYVSMPKKRKPRGYKLTGEKSQDMCPGCIAFHCDPMSMSRKFQAKIRKRIGAGVCPACGAKPIVKYGRKICKCKSH